MRRRADPYAPLTAAEFAAAFAPLADAAHIVIAVSGGPDSTALMHALAEWANPPTPVRDEPPADPSLEGRAESAKPNRGGDTPPADSHPGSKLRFDSAHPSREGSCPGALTVSTATVDHGLRSASRTEAENVGRQAAALGLPHAILTWQPPSRGPVSQDAARRARYRLLVAHARAIGATHLATAHTLDDQAETLLMRMAAGSGPAGLAGMRSAVPRGGVLHVRPFLWVAKARLVATCRVRGWMVAHDPSNADPRFARARWRAFAPSLAAEGLDAARLGRLADRARRADEALAWAADEAAHRLIRPRPDGGIELDAASLSGLPTEIGLRLLLAALTSHAPHAEAPAAGGPRNTHDRCPSFEAELRSAPQDEEVGRTALRLERLEACYEALLATLAERRSLRRTLGGRLLTLDRNGRLTVTPELPRRRGRRIAVTEIAESGGGRLGIAPAHP